MTENIKNLYRSPEMERAIVKITLKSDIVNDVGVSVDLMQDGKWPKVSLEPIWRSPFMWVNLYLPLAVVKSPMTAQM